MNKLDIKIVKSSSDLFKAFNEVQLFIDGVNLTDILKEIEKPSAEKEKNPEIAGHYIGLNLQFLKKDHFLCSDSSYGKDQNKTALLDCPCGCEGCWTSAAEILELEDTILWTDFEQIYRNGEITDDIWDYQNLKFEFKKNQYLKELGKLKTYRDRR
jgi:hypothetical protein